MRIAVMGSGGTGGYFGGLLARAGEDVTFIARGAHLEGMRSHGLTVKSRSGDFTIPVKATNDLREIGPVELVLFCVKAFDTETTAELISPLIGEDTVVLSVQNGIDNEERIAKIVGDKHVIGATAGLGAMIEEPGVIRHIFGGSITLGELAGGTSPRTERIVSTLQQAGIRAELSTNIQGDLWWKFIFICGTSGVLGLTRLPIGPGLAAPETKELLKETMEEVEAVGRHMGVAVPPDSIDRAVGQAAFLANRYPTWMSSFCLDLDAGRHLELEALNGTVVRLGREVGVPTPLNFAIYATLKPYAEGPPVLPTAP